MGRVSTYLGPCRTSVPTHGAQLRGTVVGAAGAWSPLCERAGAGRRRTPAYVVTIFRKIPTVPYFGRYINRLKQSKPSGTLRSTSGGFLASRCSKPSRLQCKMLVISTYKMMSCFELGNPNMQLKSPKLTLTRVRCPQRTLICQKPLSQSIIQLSTALSLSRSLCPTKQGGVSSRPTTNTSPTRPRAALAGFMQETAAPAGRS